MEEDWNDKCWRVLCALMQAGQTIGEPVTPIYVLLGPKKSGKSFLANTQGNATILPFNWYFRGVAQNMVPYAMREATNFDDKEEPLFPTVQVVGTYRDLLINIGDAMETMKGFVQLMYFRQLQAAALRGDPVINDSVRREWEVYFFMMLAQHGWPVYFVEITGRGEYGAEHKTEHNYVPYILSNGHVVHEFYNAPSARADQQKFTEFLANLHYSDK